MEEKKRTNTRTRTVGNGEGSLFKSKKSDCWKFQYYDSSGKRKTIQQKKKESVTDFKKRVTDLKNKLNNGTYIEKSTETFISILERYINQKYIDGITSDSSYLRDKYTVNQIKSSCSNFINMPIQKITVYEIEEAKPYIRQYAQTSIDKIWRLIHKTFQLGVARRKIIFNPMNDEILTKPISTKEPQKIEALTRQEEASLRKILNTTERNHKYRNIVLLQLDTGMRIGEVLARSKNDIDNKNQTLSIHNTLTKDKNSKIILGKHTKTYNKRTGVDKGKRIIDMNKEVQQIIQEQLKKKITNIYGLLFWDYIDNTFVKYYEINSWLKRLNEKYKITNLELSSHNLRHTYITRLREKGVDMKVIQYLVGHVEGSSITDDVYTSLSKEFIQDEMKKVN